MEIPDVGEHVTLSEESTDCKVTGWICKRKGRYFFCNRDESTYLIVHSEKEPWKSGIFPIEKVERQFCFKIGSTELETIRFLAVACRGFEHPQLPEFNPHENV
jgi:hypothetical protein